MQKQLAFRIVVGYYGPENVVPTLYPLSPSLSIQLSSTHRTLKSPTHNDISMPEDENGTLTAITPVKY